MSGRVLVSPGADAERTQQIRDLNDAFRSRMGLDRRMGRLVMTPHVASLDPPSFLALLLAVRDFDGFSAANDPHGEHDFGRLEIADEPFFWKIDNYDPSLRFCSDDPSDPDKTRRVLTLMHASEY